MNHDPFKINEAILDMWRDLKAGDDYIHRLEIRNAELVTEVTRLKAEVERLRKAGDAMANALNLNDDVFDYRDKKEAQANWTAAKEGKPSV